MICPNCKKEITQIEGKRQKVFCNSTCRSNVWQKKNREKKTKKEPPKEIPIKQEVKSESEIELRILKIEELLKLTPKYLPSQKRAVLESELVKLKLLNQK